MSGEQPGASRDKSPRGPLAGITVVDLTHVLAGPYCTMLLHDLGARVIKVERPGKGDDARQFGPFMNGRSAYFMSLNRGKESIALDLTQPADREIFDSLLEHGDVLVENFRPGTMEGLGYGWSSIEQRFPRLIYAAVSGFGQTGPYAERPAYDMVVQAMGGLMSVTGHPGAPPTRVGSSMGDITAGLFTTIGVLSALYHRAQTGRGSFVDVAMLDCQVAILENAITRYVASQQVPGPLGSRHPSIAPFQAFAVADGHIVIAAGNDQLFADLCAAMNVAELVGDPRFATNDARAHHVDDLQQLLEDRLRTQPGAYWLDLLLAAKIPCGPINNIAQVLSDPQVLARNMVVTTFDHTAGEVHMAGNPIKISGFDDPITRDPAPDLDADREHILRKI